jgi:hypothetical protein
VLEEFLLRLPYFLFEVYYYGGRRLSLRKGELKAPVKRGGLGVEGL